MHANSTPPTPPTVITPSVAHRRQMLWQVWAPLAASIILVFACAFLTIAGAVLNSPQIEKWGSISAVIVIIPWLIIGLVLMAIVGGATYGTYQLLTRMPGWMLQAQLFLLQVALIIRRVADAVTKPVVSVNTFSARVSAFWRKLAGDIR